LLTGREGLVNKLLVGVKMLEKEIEFIYTKIIGKLHAGYFDEAKIEIEHIRKHILGLYEDLLEEYRRNNDRAKFSQIKETMHELNKALREAEHYALRAGRDRNPIVINHMRAEAIKYSEEAITLLKQG
jgi:hypothetical protein